MVSARGAIVLALGRAVTLQDLLSTLYAVESPLNNPNSVAKQRLSKRVRADQYKVCLTGEGADELFGGYAHFKLERIWRF